MNQISEDHEKLRNVLISKLGLPTDRFQRDNQIAEAVVKLIEERDDALQRATNISEITKMLVEADLMRRNVNSSVEVLIKERGVVQGTINGLKQLLELPKSAGLTELFNAVEALELNNPQLNEIRYVLHGDIQPCTVLYSDDTTTLLRLDEGDIMCETDTIEWSDSVTYRCQELLRDARVDARANRVNLDAAKIMAQLVRDERILLNDDALESETVRHARHSPTSEQQHDMAKQFVQEIRRASRGMVDVSERLAER